MCRFEADVVATDRPDPARCGLLSSKLVCLLRQPLDERGISTMICAVRPATQAGVAVVIVVDTRADRDLLAAVVRHFVQRFFGNGAVIRPVEG